MCTDEQWQPRAPLRTMAISRYWITNQAPPQFHRATNFSFWLTPLDVPKSQQGWFMKFPSFSSVCTTHFPAKLR